MKRKELKIYGAFRTGSNLVRSLLELNFATLVHHNNYGYKHIPVPADYQRNRYIPFPIDIVTTVKDPYAFLDSTFRYCVRTNYLNISAGRTFAEFLYQPFIVFDGGFKGFPRYRFTNPVQYWNSFYHNLLSIPEPRNIIVRYEDLLLDMPGEMLRIAEKFDLQRRKGDFVYPGGLTINMGDQERSAPGDYFRNERFERQDYYLNREYMDGFTDHQLTFIAAELDEEIVGQLGYALCAPATVDGSADVTELARFLREPMELQERLASLHGDLAREHERVQKLTLQLQADKEEMQRLEASRDEAGRALERCREELRAMQQVHFESLDSFTQSTRQMSDALEIARHQVAELDRACQAEADQARGLKAELHKRNEAFELVHQQLGAVQNAVPEPSQASGFIPGNGVLNATAALAGKVLALPGRAWRYLRTGFGKRSGG